MKTIALRFSDNFAPECGTMVAHEQLIEEIGHVWYGKLGNKVSEQMLKVILESDDPKILLIHSGKTGRYWAHINKAQNERPELEEIPAYYPDDSDKFKTWFCVTRFEKAEKDVMSRCIVSSSGALLGNASRHSMSPYFKIEYEDDNS